MHKSRAAFIDERNHRDQLRESARRRHPLASFLRAAALLSCSLLANGQTLPLVIEYAIPYAGSHPQAVAAAYDGSVWFTDPATNSIGRVGTVDAVHRSAITEYPIPTPACGLIGITVGGDQALWFTESNANKIGRITTAGVITEYAIPTPASGPNGITAAFAGYPTVSTGFSDYGIWFTESNANQIGKISPSGVITEYPIPTPASKPMGIAWADDNAAWFTEYNGNKIGRIALAGTITEYPIPTPNAGALGISEMYGILTFTESTVNQIGQIVSLSSANISYMDAGQLTEYPLPTASSGAIGVGGNCVTLAAVNLIDCVSGGYFAEYPVLTPAAGLQGIAPAGSGSGIYWFAESAAGKIAVLSVSVISGQAPSIRTSNVLPTAQVGHPYSATISGSGTPGPFQWSALPGALPAGLTLTTIPGNVSTQGNPLPTAATIAGTPTVAGTQVFDVSLTDGNGITVAQTFTLPVATAGCNFTLSSTGQAFPSVGGSGSIFVTATPGCPWTVTAPPGFSASNAGTGNVTSVGSGTVAYTVPANSSASPLTATLSVAGQTFTIQQQAGGTTYTAHLQFPHFASGAGWRTTFTLVDEYAFGPAEVLTSFYDDNGNLVPTPITLATNPTAAPVTESWVNLTMAPFQTATFDAADLPHSSFGDGSVQMYGAQFNLETFGAFAMLRNDVSGQIAVEPSGGSGNVIPFDNTNGFTNGIVVQNSDFRQETFLIALVDDNGASLGNESVTLPANGHSWISLATQYPETANRRGAAIFGNCTVEAGTATVPCSGLSTLALRITPQDGLTTLPALGSGVVLPHFMAGAGWQTTFVLSNALYAPSFVGNPALAQLNFFDDLGNPLALPLTFPQTGANTAATSIHQTIPVNGTLLAQTAALPTDPLISGSALLAQGTSGFAILRYNPTGQEAVIPFGYGPFSGTTLAFDNTGGNTTYAALSLASLFPRNFGVAVVIRDEQGNQIATDSYFFLPNGHTYFSVASKYPVTANIRGTIEFSEGVAAGILLTPSGAFATLPESRHLP